MAKIITNAVASDFMEIQKIMPMLFLTALGRHIVLQLRNPFMFLKIIKGLESDIFCFLSLLKNVRKRAIVKCLRLLLAMTI
jgi:hypothetical protein